MESCEVRYGQVCEQGYRQGCAQAGRWGTQNDEIKTWRLETCTQVQAGAAIDSNRLGELLTRTLV